MSHVVSLRERKKESGWFAARRDEARKAFETLPDPSFAYGLNIFFNAKGIALPYASGLRLDARRSTLDAPEGIDVLTLEEALADESLASTLQEALAARPLADRVDAWHEANADGGLVVVAYAGVEAAEPLTIDVELGDAVRLDRLVVIAEPHARLTIVERVRPAGTGMRVAATDVIVRPGAKVTHVAVGDLGEAGIEFVRRDARVEAGGSLTWIECGFGGAYRRSRTATALAGEGAEARMKSLFFGRAEEKYDYWQEVRHLAPRTTSDIVARAALDDAAKGIYRGLVRIEKGMAGCTGRQKEDALLLGARAEIDAVPNLEIANGDVRCGHSASVGRLDKEKLFFLMSRGLEEVAARKLLVEGFFAPVVEDMHASGLKEMVECLIGERVDRQAARC